MSRPLALLAATLLLAFGASTAAAQDSSSPDPNEIAVSSSHKSTAELISDLTSSSGSTRLYAARSLKSQLRVALRTEVHGRPDTIRHDEALAKLVELDARLPSACTSALRNDNVVPACAEMLAMLGATASVPAIEGARDRVKSAGGRRRVDAALACLAGTGRCPQETKGEFAARSP